jgi:nicotinate-nucleotide adenylyltransferase
MQHELKTENRKLITGLFFGSFNPIHLGHLVIANYMANYTLKQKAGLADMYDRLEMARLATENAPHLKVSDIEFKLPQPSYTVDTMAHIKEKHPEKEFALIMGADNLASLKKWKNYEVLLQNHQIFVYPRPNADVSEWENHPSIVMTQTPQMDISSTFIRQAVKQQKSIQFLVPDAVIDFMDKKSLYKSL